MLNMKRNTQDAVDRFVSLKALAAALQADRATVRRWLRTAGIQALVMGEGRNGGVRYKAAEVEAWLRSRVSR